MILPHISLSQDTFMNGRLHRVYQISYIIQYTWFKYEGYSVGVCFILFLTVANVYNYYQEISAYQEIAHIRCMAHLNTFCLNCQVSLAKKKIKFMKYLACSGKCIILYCIYRESIQFLLIGRHIVALLFLFQQVQNINTFNIQKALPKK